MTETKTKWRRAAIFVFTLLIMFCLLLPAVNLDAYAASRHARHGKTYSRVVKKQKKHRKSVKHRADVRKTKTPGVVSGIFIGGNSDGEVIVYWDKPSGTVTSYKLNYKIGDNGWRTVNTGIRDHHTLRTGYDKNILVRVRAYNRSKAGRWSRTKKYYMKPEYEHYEIGTQSVTMKYGETKKLPCKYVKGWKKEGPEISYSTDAVDISRDKNNPEFLYIKAHDVGNSVCTISNRGPSGGNSYSIKIQITDPEVENKIAQIREELGITDSTSDLMKAKLAADWMVKHVDYDYAAYEAMQRGDYSQGEADISIRHILLDDHPLTVCEGYAKAYAYLLEDFGVPVNMISTCRGNHAWNIVKIDGHWYNVDTTWMEGAVKPHYDYFMVSYQKMTSQDKDNHHNYYTDSDQAEYRTDDTRFDGWTNKWKDYTDSGDVSDGGTETHTSDVQQTAA
jgi:hypothetical protein